jgi:hypothetical protein
MIQVPPHIVRQGLGRGIALLAVFLQGAKGDLVQISA